MRKIKGFKLSLKPKELARRAKKAGLDLQPLGFLTPPVPRRESEPTESFVSWTAVYEQAVAPAVVFESFPAPSTTEAQMLSPMPGLAYSLIVATLGAGWTQAKAKEVDPERAPVLGVLEDLALEEAIRFAAAIVEQEAMEDGCTLSPMTILSDAPALELALGKVSGEKIGVALDNGALSPSASRACTLSWLAKTKSKGKK
jgi:hypothetical protein